MQHVDHLLQLDRRHTLATVHTPRDLVDVDAQRVHLTPHGQQVHVRRLRHGRTSQHGHPGPKHPGARDAVPLGEVCDLPRLLIVKPYSEAVPARLTARTPAVASLIS